MITFLLLLPLFALFPKFVLGQITPTICLKKGSGTFELKENLILNLRKISSFQESVIKAHGKRDMPLFKESDTLKRRSEN